MNSQGTPKRRAQIPPPPPPLLPQSPLPIVAQEVIAPLGGEQFAPARASYKTLSLHRLGNLSLRLKATVLAIAMGTVPVMGVGMISYYFANRSLTQEMNLTEQENAEDLGEAVNRFMGERYGDITVLSSLPILRSEKVRRVTTPEEKQNLLDRYIEAYSIYDSIAVYDLAGQLIVKSSTPADKNIQDEAYFKQVIATNGSVITQPAISPATKQRVVFLAAPIKDATTNRTISIVRTRMPVSHIEKIAKGTTDGRHSYHLVDSTGNLFIASEAQQVGQAAGEQFSGIDTFLAERKPGITIGQEKIDNTEKLTTYAPIDNLEGATPLNWGAIRTIDTYTAFAPQRQLLIALGLGTVAAAVLIAAIAAWLANQAVQPLLSAAETVEKIGSGDLSARLDLQGQDELARLGNNINTMASKLEVLVQDQSRATQEAQLLAEISGTRAITVAELDDLFQQALGSAQAVLAVDRLVIYRFNPDWSGAIIAEATAAGQTSILNEAIVDACIPADIIAAYEKGRVVATPDVFNADFHPEHVALMRRLRVRANLVVPVLNQGKLFGLLVAHQCTQTHHWQEREILFLQQLASELSTSIDRVTFLKEIQSAQQEAEGLAEEQRQLKEGLQKRALTLLMEVDPVSRGDLTIRAKVTEDEIGTVADSYNATIESLRKIVSQVQAAARQVADTASTNETSVQALSMGAFKQTAEITEALDRVQEMATSIRIVAANAQQAETTVQQAVQTVQEGDDAMNRTVEGILAIRETVGETAKKVKRLGESSQKISKVVNLIGTFAAQTNLLALNASIEAARAGEEGRGFAVVADEVRSLARQSADATAEIEKLVANIQAETNEVVAAMEAGTEQVVAGTQLVDETRQSLTRIASASSEINQLVNTIAQAAAVQSQASESVTQTMTNVAAIAQQTSSEATQVSNSFHELLEVATNLQAEVGQFKVQ